MPSPQLNDEPPVPMRPLQLCVVQLDAIPQALTERDRLWAPAEPLVDPVTAGTLVHNDLSASHLFSASAGDNATHILRKVQNLATEVTTGRLSEILAFVRDQRADIVVLPEYLLPVHAIDVLVGFSRDVALVAGLGVIRNRADAATVLAKSVAALQPEELIGRNVSVLVENERVHVVTKRSPSQREAAVEGQGPKVVRLQLAGRPVTVGVAICMDYLRHHDELLEHAPDVVCVPAFTANIGEFQPGAPRDYVRLLANCAAFGGSTIFAPSLRGPVFTDNYGVRHLQAGIEGVIIVQHDRYESKPTALRRTENRLRLRAAIIERNNENEVGLEAIRQLGDLRELAAQSSVADLAERLTRWLWHIDQRSPLRDALEEYRRSLVQELDDVELYRVLSTHVTVASGGRSVSIRAHQARFVIQRLNELVASGMEVPVLGRALDAYAELAAKAPEPSATIQSREGQRWRFSVGLGKYERTTAASTLPRQLNFLRAIAHMPAGAMSLTYRLHSEQSAFGPDLQTKFDVIVEGIEDIVEAKLVEGQLRSMLVESWAVSATDEPASPPEARFCIRISPNLSSTRPSVREDWASVADLLRTHSSPVSLDLRVEPIAVPEQPPSGSDLDDAAWLSMLRAIPSMTVGDEADRRAGAYFSLLHDLSRDELRGLGLSVVLASPTPIPQLLIQTIQSELFGNLPATADPVDSSVVHCNPTPLSPSELIGFFHPPYGRIQGRGVPQEGAEEIPFTGKSLPAAGTQLGTTRVASPREDRRVEGPLDESARSRHVYVIGRTGTGKTNFLKDLCRQDISSGRGLAVIDPHGDLVDYLAAHCQERLADTVLLDFGRPDMIPLFNPLTVDVRDARTQALHTTDFLRVLESRYYSEFTGPVFDDMVRQALETMFEADFPVSRSLDLVEVMYRNREIRQMVARTIPANSVLRDRWNVFETMPEKEKAERITWMLSKFADLMPPDSPLRMSLCTTRKSPLSIEDTVWRDGILLIKIPESSIGPDAASFLGTMLVRRIERAVFDYQRGTGRAASERPVFTLCIDEFQKFATAGLESLVAEARKFGCGLVLAHQNLEQLFAYSRFEGARSRELLSAILGNVSSTLAFRVGPQDASEVADLLQAEPSAFERLPKYKALCRLTVDAEQTPCFTLTVPDADRLRGTPAATDRLRERMVADGYWATVDVVAAELGGHLTRFEAALEHTKSDVEEAERRRMSAVATRVQESPDDIAEIIAEEFDGGEMFLGFLRDIFSALIAHHTKVAAGYRDECAALILDAALVMLDEPADTEWGSHHERMSSLLGKQADRDPEREEERGRLLDGLVRLCTRWAASELPLSDLVEHNHVVFDGLLLAFTAEDLDEATRGPIVRLIAAGGDTSHLCDHLRTAVSEQTARSVDALVTAVRDAAARLPVRTVWTINGGVSDAVADAGAGKSTNARGTSNMHVRWSH